MGGLIPFTQEIHEFFMGFEGNVCILKDNDFIIIFLEVFSKLVHTVVLLSGKGWLMPKPVYTETLNPPQRKIYLVKFAQSLPQTFTWGLLC